MTIRIQALPIARLAGVAVAAMMFASACSSSGGGSTNSASAAGGGAASSGGASSSAPAGGASSGGASSSDDNGGGSGGSSGSGGGTNAAGKVELETQNSKFGQILTDSNGRTVYMFASDSPTKSACSGACLQFWPPVLTSGQVEASDGVTQSKIKTLKRTDGKTQVVYNGRPLYYFIQDAKKGDVNGQARTDFNSVWWVLTPAGAPIKQNA